MTILRFMTCLWPTAATNAMNDPEFAVLAREEKCPAAILRVA
jgi:hypothetical protein